MSNRWFRVLLLGSLLLVAACGNGSPSAPATVTPVAVTITEYPLPEAGSVPQDIAVGPDGALWFTEDGTFFASTDSWMGGNKIGRITANGQITEFPLPTSASIPAGIVAGPNGALWFSERAGRIGRMTPDGALVEYPTGEASPTSITVGPDGALWFSDYNNNRIGRLTPSGTITQFPLPHRDLNYPGSIITGPDGAVWFTEGSLDKDRIGRLTTGGLMTEFSLPTQDSRPHGLTVGPDGALWFTEVITSRIGRITPSGTITEIPLLPKALHNVSGGITTGPDGALWFTEWSPQSGGHDAIGRVTPSGVVQEFPIPTPDSKPIGIATGPDGALWFTEENANQIGRIQIKPAAFPVSTTTVSVLGGTATATLTPAPAPSTPPPPAPPSALTWSVRAVGNDLQIAYGSGTSYPQYASLDLSSSYFRLVYSTDAHWGTSVVLLPAFWSSSATCPPGSYCQGAPVQADWSLSGASLVLSIRGTIGGLAVHLTVRLDPPANNQIVAYVSASITNGSVIPNAAQHPWDAFKPVMLSSMHVSSAQWDAQTAYAGGHSYSLPSCCWIADPPVTSTTFGLVGGTSTWKVNAPTVGISLASSLPITGWVTSDANPNDDNISLWAASTSVLPSWSYRIAASKA